MININSEDFDIEKIAESGQCFRMTRLSSSEDHEEWQIVAADRSAAVKSYPADGHATIVCPDADNAFWTHYFDLETDYGRFRASVDPDDEFLSAAVEYGKGIRILHQDSWEMLITFIISQRRSIPSIRTCVERLCRRWGTRITEDIYAFPTAKQLAEASCDELLECGLGYRAEYVYLAAKGVADGVLDLEGWNALSDEELYGRLLSLRGVGPKVANCVSLFGYYRVAAFPVDVWIDRVQKQFYSGRFPTEKYEGYAGIMQQYIFYYARKK